MLFESRNLGIYVVEFLRPRGRGRRPGGYKKSLPDDNYLLYLGTRSQALLKGAQLGQSTENAKHSFTI